MGHILSEMSNTMQLVKGAYYTYCGASVNLVLVYLAFFSLFFSLGKNTDKGKQDKFLLWLSIVLAAVTVFPVSAWIIMKYCVESSVYRRMFWMIPIPLLVGYAGARLVAGENAKWRKFFTGALLAVIIIVTGANLYTPQNFTKASNPYKLMSGVISVCDIIQADAAEQGIEDVGMIATDDLIIQIRQYDASIRMPYGRDMLNGETGIAKRSRRIYQELNGEQLNAQALAFDAKKGDYQYLVTWSDETHIQPLSEAGYEWIGETDHYFIYRLDGEKVSNILVSRYGSSGDDQGDFYTIETAKGRLIVIDRGTETDADYVREVLSIKGKRVNAWILANYSRDDAGILGKICENPGNIKISKVYAVSGETSWDEDDSYEQLQKIGIEKINYLQTGDKQKIAGVKMEVLNARDEYADGISNSVQNNGAMMLKVYGKKENLLFGTDPEILSGSFEGVLNSIQLH